jgi:hypothetical protein
MDGRGRCHDNIFVERLWWTVKHEWVYLRPAANGIEQKRSLGEFHGSHPLPDGPWIFSRADLATSAAQTITERARRNPRHPTGSHPDQQSLFSSMTQTDGCSDARLYQSKTSHSQPT